MKNKDNKKNHKNFFKRNLSLLLGTVLFSAAIVSIGLVGWAYSNTSSFDMIIGINKKPNINFHKSTGDITRIAINFQDGLIKNNLGDNASKELIANEDAWPDEEIRLQYEALTADAYGYMVNDLDLIDPNVDQGDPTANDIEITGYTNAIAEKIYVDSAYQNYKFYIRGDYEYSTSIGNPLLYTSGETVKPSDFGFALMNIINKRNASSAEYISANYALIRGTQEWSEYQSEIINSDDETEDFNELYKLFYDADAGPNGINQMTGVQNPPDPTQCAMIFSNEEGYVQYQTLGNNAFLTTLNNPSFMPLDQIWYERSGLSFFTMGMNAQSISTYGSYNVTKFDTSYGIEALKNQDHHDAMFTVSESILFRSVSEPSTQLAVFNSGDFTSFHPSEITDGKIFKDDSFSSQYIDWQLTPPTTRFLVGNFEPDNVRPDAIYYKNPNFRKALYYATDRSEWRSLAGADRAVNSSILTPHGMGNFSNGLADSTSMSVADYAYYLEYMPQDVTAADGIGSQYLNYFSEASRAEIIGTEQSVLNEAAPYERGVNEITNIEDPRTNIELAQFYWEEFIKDMTAIGVTVPPGGIELEFSTSTGEADPLPKAINASLENASIPLSFTTKTIVGSWISYWIGGDFDFISIGWSPDVGDPWGTLSIFNDVNREKTHNFSPAWNFWTGTDESYGNTYTIDQMAVIEDQWSKDGFFAMRESGDLKTMIPDVVTNDVGEVVIDGLHTFMDDIDWETEVDAFTKLVVTTAGEMEVRQPDENPIPGYNNTFEQIDGTTQEEVFGLSQDDKVRLFLILEVLSNNGNGALQYRNSIPGGVPSTTPFVTTPGIGYASFVYGYNSIDESKPLYPSIEDVLASR